MKKILITAALGIGIAASCYAQGYFAFNNTANIDGNANSFLPFIGAGGAAGQGAVGAVIGSDPTFATPNYVIGYRYLLGGGHSADDFASGSPTTGTVDGSFLFVGPTGSPDLGAGAFDAGKAIINGTADGDNITIQVMAWYDPSGATTFDSARSLGFNVGLSTPITVRLAAGTDNVIADLTSPTALQGFSVQPVPEPATFALAGIGAAALMIFRRRK
jgi:hypothetical protein